jgi:hypothetical protein
MKQLKPDVWAAIGGAGNSTIIVGKTSVIVVDAKQTEPGAKDLLAEIAKITPAGDHRLPHTQRRRSRERPRGVSGRCEGDRARKQQEGTGSRAGGGAAAPRRPIASVTGGDEGKETMTIDGVKLELHHWRPRIRAAIS